MNYSSSAPIVIEVLWVDTLRVPRDLIRINIIFLQHSSYFIVSQIDQQILRFRVKLAGIEVNKSHWNDRGVAIVLIYRDPVCNSRLEFHL